MKRRKVLLLIPMFGLLLSGCSFAEVKSAIGDSWFGQHILHPIYDPIKNWINGGSKDEPTPEPGPGEKTVASIVSVSAPSTIKQGETLAASSVTLNVTYSDESTGTVQATSVELDTSELGEKEGTAYYNTLSKTFTITVVEKGSTNPEHAGTDEDPFTVEDALLVGGALEKGGVTDEEYVIKGFVTSVKADFSTEYGNLTFNMGDFLCYRVFKGSEKAKFESQDDVQVGDRVTVHSKIKNYNGTIETVEKEGYTTAIEKVDHGKISEIVSVVGPTSVALNGTITPEEVTVTIKYEDGFVTTVHPKAVELDTKTAGDKEAVVTIDGFEGTGKFAVKVVEGELPNEIEAAYAKAVTLKNDGTEASAESYLIRGVVVGTRGTEDYFVQSGSYGIDVYKPDSSAGFAVGKEVEVKATVCNYKGLYETKTIAAGSAKVIGNAQLPTPADVTSESVHNELKMNILAKASGVVKEDVSVVADKDVSFTLTVGGSYDVTIFVKKALVASFPALSTYKAGDALSIENLVTGQYNANKQLIVCNNTTISKGVDPTKTVSEIIDIQGPTSIYVGDPLSESQFTVEVKYTDNTTAKVSATSISNVDTSKEAENVAVEVYVGEVHSTYHLDIIEKPEPTVIVEPGVYHIKHGNYYMAKTRGGSGQPLVTQNESEAEVLDFVLQENTVDQYKIKIHGGDDYLHSINNNNGLRFGDTEAVWKIEGGLTTLSGNYLMSCKDSADNTRYLTLYYDNNAATDFRSYKGADTNRKENTDFEAVDVQVLDSISVTHQPTKDTYFVGDVFDPTGLEVTASYTSQAGSSQAVVTGYTLDHEGAFVSGDVGQKTITVSYTEAGVTKTTTFTVTVYEKTLTSISLEGPTKKAYKVGESLELSDLVVTAHYEWAAGEDSKVVTNYTVDQEGAFGEGDISDAKVITVSYTEGATTRTATFEVSVSAVEAELLSITIEGDMTKKSYGTGEPYSIAGLSVVAHYDDESFLDVTGSAVITYKQNAEFGDTTLQVSALYQEHDAQKTIEGITVANPTVKKWAQASSVQDGQEIILVNTTASKELTSVNSSNVGVATAYTDEPNHSYILTVEAGPGSNQFYLKDSSNKYLAYNKAKGTTSNNNIFLLSDKTADGTLWTIVFDGNQPTITNVYNDERCIKFNNDRFCCYTSTQQPVQIFSLQDVEVVPATSVTFSEDSYSVKETETVTISAEVNEEATIKGVSYSLQNAVMEEFASINSETGELTGLKEGNVTVVATSVGTPSVSSTVTVTITEKGQDEIFSKVSSDLSDYKGTYLLVCESENVAFGGVDSASNTFGVTIEESTITNPGSSCVRVAIETCDDGYALKVVGGTNNGKYMWMDKYDNGLKFSDDPVKNDIDIDANGNAVISITYTGGTVTLKYNKSSGQERFRYYKTGQTDVQLYKLN